MKVVKVNTKVAPGQHSPVDQGTWFVCIRAGRFEVLMIRVSPPRTRWALSQIQGGYVLLCTALLLGPGHISDMGGGWRGYSPFVHLHHRVNSSLH